MKKLMIVGFLSLLAGPAWAQDWIDTGPVCHTGPTTGEIHGQSFSGTWSAGNFALEGDLSNGDRFSGHYNPTTGEISGEIHSRSDDDEGD